MKKTSFAVLLLIAAGCTEAPAPAPTAPPTNSGSHEMMKQHMPGGAHAAAPAGDGAAAPAGEAKEGDAAAPAGDAKEGDAAAPTEKKE